MTALNLIAYIAGQRIALATDVIESVIELEAVTPVPLAAPHIAGLAPLRSRVLTIVDTYAALALGRFQSDGVLHAVVVTVDGHLYGLLVDEVEDVVTFASDPEPLPAGLAAGWAANALGVIEHDGRPILLLDPARLVMGPSVAVAA